MSPSTANLPLSFHDAVTGLRAFLRSHGRPEAIVWVMPDDLIEIKSRLRACVRSPNRRWMDAQVRYELGLERKMGIVLCQVCQAPGISCCHVYIPKNQTDATARALGGAVKFSMTPAIRPAGAVTNRLHWSWLKMRGRPVPFDRQF